MKALSRRGVLALLLAAPALAGLRARAGEPFPGLRSAVAALERKHGGRLGIAILDTGSNESFAYRGDEIFAMCSTFKFVLVAAILARVDRRDESLDRQIAYGRHDLLSHAPVTAAHVADGRLTVGELCDAAMTQSDNTAANLLLATLDGPGGVTAYARSLGDGLTRLDRMEPDLNSAAPGDPRDTTTPRAMLDLLRQTSIGHALSPSSRVQLIAWLRANQTGGQRLRAGLPASWSVGDKTGSGDNNTANDIAVIWPPARAPLLVTAFYTGSHASGKERDAVLAAVGKLAAASAA